jgi:hypothetical protein
MKKPNLSSNGDLFEILKTSRTLCAIRIVEDYSDASFCHSGLATFINEILLVRSTHLYSMRCVLGIMYDEP